MTKTKIKGFLIPEFVSLTGMSDEQRADYKCMKDIAPYTKLKPEERVEQTSKMVEMLNRSGKVAIGAAKRVPAF